MNTKVLHVITGLGEGGAEAVLYRLCLADRNATHTVVSLLCEGKYGASLKEAGVEVHALGLRRGRLGLRGFFRLCRVIKSVKPDVVQTWLYHADLAGGLAARITGFRRVVWNIRNSVIDERALPWTTNFAMRLCAKISKVLPVRIVCCAEKAAQVHIEVGYAASKMCVIQNGYDLSRFRCNRELGLAVRRELDLPSLPVIGFVARFDPQKDHHNLLRAVALVRASGHRFSCLLVGREMNSSNALLMSWIKELGIEDVVRLAGSRSDIPAVMNAIDLHVLSSVSEGFPNVLAEAMACGTPCVSTDVGDARAIVGDTGWIVRPQEPEALAEAIRQALIAMRDSVSWQHRRELARSRVEELYSLEGMVKAYQAVWRDVLGN